MKNAFVCGRDARTTAAEDPSTLLRAGGATDSGNAKGA